MHHTGYKPDTAVVIGAGNAMDSALQKGLQKVGFRVQLLSAEQFIEGGLPDGVRPIIVNAASCAGGIRMPEAKAVCHALLNQSCHAILHLSSYGVFGHVGSRKIDEDAEPDPLSERGRDWFACEQTLTSLDNVSILRLGWQVDRSEQALLGRVIRSLLDGRAVSLDDASLGNPVTVSDLVRVVVAITQQLASGAPTSGLYHYGSADTCTAMDFGREVVDRMRSLNGDDFAAELTVLEPAEKDRSYVLACGRLRDVFGIQQRSWRQGLTRQVELWLERLQKPAS
ncbi:sugar nucleotide-binding protein [Microbulbifer agarilyticus]|uniref:sugar nucleotide-binding protein n=1 Tax=Microbulbifer agarilyticus TaxID=260552 RepID=UPI001CD69B1D|nr:sugar nucleotide-binding protein [Microbulbifer agarilyticus]MCA0902168.1 NAD(P)-dependent oxidoreductase [Microbulbifer agarilyticus]